MAFGLSVPALIAPAFMSGVLMFLAPCTLPLLPAYLAFISGVSLDELKNPGRVHLARQKVVWNGLWYVVGFSLVFILLGSVFGAAGSFLGGHREFLARAGGVAVLFFGLTLLGVIRFSSLARESRFHLEGALKPGHPVSSFLFGATFAFGWTPCIGPILGSVLLLASHSATAGRGALLLLVFSLGLAVPFMAMAFGFGWAARHLSRFGRALRAVELIGGAALTCLGLLLIFDRFDWWLRLAYRLFHFVNYSRLLDYL